VAAAEGLDHLLVDGIDNLLHGGQALGDLGAEGLLANALHELADDLVVYVSFEEG
jgi:hypothetical protein